MFKEMLTYIEREYSSVEYLPKKEDQVKLTKELSYWGFNSDSHLASKVPPWIQEMLDKPPKEHLPSIHATIGKNWEKVGPLKLSKIADESVLDPNNS